MTERELIDKVLSSLLGDFTNIVVKGPLTTLYWDNAAKDNVPQQSMTITVDQQSFDIIIREKK